jgi:transcription initiation factor TFIIIB Brf1 subunit/transcription initiation factor TFIIB
MQLTDIEKCKNLINFLEENEIMSDNSPTSSCAAILYYYSEKNKLGYTKKQFADICNVSEVTVIKGFKTISKFDKFIDKNFKY